MFVILFFCFMLLLPLCHFLFTCIAFVLSRVTVVAADVAFIVCGTNLTFINCFCTSVLLLPTVAHLILPFFLWDYLFLLLLVLQSMLLAVFVATEVFHAPSVLLFSCLLLAGDSRIIKNATAAVAALVVVFCSSFCCCSCNLLLFNLLLLMHFHQLAVSPYVPRG